MLGNKELICQWLGERLGILEKLAWVSNKLFGSVHVEFQGLVTHPGKHVYRWATENRRLGLSGQC